MQKKKVINRMLKMCASVLLATSILTGAVNVSPTFADTLKHIPFLGEIVKVLQFTDDKAEGGTITDGTDIKDINIVDESAYEEITITFSNQGEDQALAGAYQVVKDEFPSTLTFEIYGARRFTAMEDFKALSESEYVKDIYPLITLDDSLIRFVVLFEEQVDCEITEMKNPARLVIRISETAQTNTEEHYIVRTHSYPAGETFAMIEELYFLEDDKRIIKDAQDWFVLELGSFDSLTAAEQFIEGYKVVDGHQLFIEKRGAQDLPKHMINIEE